jgi:hypothetical protein
MAVIINLDALRAESKKIIFLGREYELGYIPSGASIPIMDAYQSLYAKQILAAGGGGVDDMARYASECSEEIVEDSITFVHRFCSFFYPEVTRKEISLEASREMVDAFFTEIITSIVRNSAMGKSEGDKGENVKKNTTGENQ